MNDKQRAEFVREDEGLRKHWQETEYNNRPISITRFVAAYRPAIDARVAAIQEERRANGNITGANGTPGSSEITLPRYMRDHEAIHDAPPGACEPCDQVRAARREETRHARD